MSESIFHSFELVLASKSPRRRQLLSQLGFGIQYVDINVDESKHEPVSPELTAETLALLKAKAFPAEKLGPNQILVTADTVVVHNNQVLGKPKDRTEAFSMLTSLSGDCNHVYTGVCLKHADLIHSFTEKSDVFFRPLQEWEINYYLDNYDYLDKAGSYGIQEWIGMIGVSRIEGCYYNVMGLPLTHLYEELLHLILKS